jgi:hypothetical protein
MQAGFPQTIFFCTYAKQGGVPPPDRLAMSVEESDQLGKVFPLTPLVAALTGKKEGRG